MISAGVGVGGGGEELNVSDSPQGKGFRCALMLPFVQCLKYIY